MEKVYYIESVRCCYPFQTEHEVFDYGVLKKYMGKEYNRSEIDKIIAEMIIKHPYIKNAMHVKVCIEYKHIIGTKKSRGIYHNLRFANDNYKNQAEENKNGVQYEL